MCKIFDSNLKCLTDLQCSRSSSSFLLILSTFLGTDAEKIEPKKALKIKVFKMIVLKKDNKESFKPQKKIKTYPKFISNFSDSKKGYNF